MDALKAALVRGLLRISACLPLGAARGLGRVAAAINWWIGGRARRITEQNLALAYPQMPMADREKLARHSLAATGELVAEMGHVWLGPWERLRARLEIHGDELLIEAMSTGRGVLVLAPHIGNWEVVGLHIASLGTAVSLYQPPRLAGLNTLMLRARQRTGSNLVPTDQRGVAALLRTLHSGGLAGLLPDQLPGKGAAGLNAPFMGVPCFTGTLPNRLLRQTGALAVVAFARRVPHGFVLRYRRASEEVADEDPTHALTVLNREVEQCVRECPEQYQWEYKRFRTRPPRVRGNSDKVKE